MLYQQRSAPPPGGEPDEFVMSDDSIDRMGDVLEQNWQFDKLSTIALFNHDRDKIIGSWRDVSVRNGRLVGRLVWTNSNEWPGVKYLRDLVREGHLRACSVGFQPIDSEPLDKANPSKGHRFKKSSLLECSLVSVPANPNALAIAKELPRDLIAEIFCKPATEDSGRSPAAHGKSAAPHLETRRVSSMSIAATIANKIQNAQQTLNGLLASYEDLAGRSEMSDDETKRYRDELPAQIDAAKTELESHKRSERILLGGEPRGDTKQPL